MQMLMTCEGQFKLKKLQKVELTKKIKSQEKQ